MKTAVIIGAGQLGSRHLQALKSVTTALEIYVIDPSDKSLKVAKERYDTIDSKQPKQRVTFANSLPDSLDIEIAIVATNADVRRTVVEKMLRTAKVRHLILEKLLFSKPEDYPAVAKLLREKNVACWVNCSMRTMPFYQTLQKHFKDLPLTYTVTGSQFGLVTNAIHYLDHVAFLTGCPDFTISTQYLNPRPIESKRPGFLELNGTLLAEYQNGSIAALTCYSDGNAPVVVEICNQDYRCISRESEKLAWISNQKQNWQWSEVPSNLPYQSAMTTDVVEELLKKGTCSLTPYAESMSIHLNLLPKLQEFLDRKSTKQFDHYPFT